MSNPRLQRPDRLQFRLIPATLDGALAAEHPARDIWSYLDTIDLAPLYATIKAVDGAPGRPAIDPKLLLALWVFATTEAVGSARELAELCERDLPYMWLCGGVCVNYHTLADFRSKNEKTFQELLQRHITSLVASNVVQLQRVARDGVRVRASAGDGSFRRRSRLEEVASEVRQQLELLAKELHDDPGASQRRKEAGKKRALEARAAKVAAAIERTRQIDKDRTSPNSHRSKKEQAKRKNDADEGNTRASATDGDASIMVMADGGYRPAYNCQAAMDPASGFVIATQISQDAGDGARMPPMVAELLEKYATRPTELLVDGGYSTHAAINTVESAGTKVYAPVKAPKTAGVDRYAPHESDSAAVAVWRARMGTVEAKAIRKLRSQIEWCFARLRNWGLRQFTVRTTPRVESSFYLYILTHNFMNEMRLRIG